MDNTLQRARVVLVRPSIVGNIGATARVMRNFGLYDLRLVRPHADPFDEQARKMSTHGESILNQSRSVGEFGEAVADCVMVVGTSARIGGPFRRQNVMEPRALMPRVVDGMANGPVALVFGPEQTGLTDAEVSRCHYLMTIPTGDEYPALNLAQAVAIALYELFVAIRGWHALNTDAKGVDASQGTARPSEYLRDVPPDDVADFALQERMFGNLESALRRLHFLWGDNGDTLMHALRHLIGRARPSRMEVKLLLGLARQVEWWGKKHVIGDIDNTTAGG